MDRPELKTIFSEALDRPPGPGRAAYLDAACHGDPALRAQVEALLEDHARVGHFLASQADQDTPQAGEAETEPDPDVRSGAGPTRTAVPATVADPTAPAPAGAVGARIGPYKLLEPIGEGGMGTVYMAEQTEPVKRLVALKVIKAGMDSRPVLARFEAERQALALMDHPHIAKVLDAGTTPEGRPFFVMELVKGLPITQFCDERRLTPRERLELLVPVCQAVQHAHQKGVIHRDIKPSNVLVALYDGRPVPKVIDFGVAKAIGTKLTEETLFTGFGAIVGTPEYMSPEQAELNQLDIDTRSDVYALGVLLYELLTGTTPLTRARLRQAAFLEVLRMVREEEPPRPSNRLSTTEELPSIAANRGIEPRRLTGLLRGELDWIVMKALEKDRSRRYETANGLAADLRRYLDDEPVLACPPSARYRIGKYARRHRAALTTAALLLAALVLGTAVSTWQAVRATAAERATVRALREVDRRRAEAEAQRQRAEERSQLARRAVDEMYTEVAEKWLAHEGRLTALQRQFLEKALAFYQEFAAERASDPKVRREAARAAERAGQIRAKLGHHGPALESHRQALEAYRRLVADFPAEADFRRGMARALLEAGGQLDRLGRTREAERDTRQAVALREQLAKAPGTPDDRCDLAVGLRALGRLLEILDRGKDAEPIVRRSAELLERLAREVPAEPRYRAELAGTENNLGVLCIRSDHKQDEAERHYRRALELRRRLAADEPTNPDSQYGLAQSYHNFGSFYGQYRFDYDKAVEEYRRAVPIQEKLVADHPDRPAYREFLAFTLSALADQLARTGRFDEAERATSRSLETAERLAADFPDVPEYQARVAAAASELGARRAQAGDGRGAWAAFERAYALRRRLAADHPEQPDYRHNLAATCYAIAVHTATLPDPRDRDPARTQERAREAVRNDPNEAGFWKGLALAEYRAGHLDAALEAETRALDLRKGNGYAYDWLLMALIQFGRGDREAARLWYHRACAVRGPDGNWGGEADLMRLGAEAGPRLRPIEPTTAEEMLRAREWQLTQTRRSPGWENIWLQWDLEKLADQLAAMGRDARAAELLEESRRLNPDRYAIYHPFGPWFPLGVLRLRAGDLAGHRALCAELLRRFGQTRTDTIAEQTVRLVTAVPGAVDDPARLVALGRMAAESDPKQPWYLLAQGAAEYRAGRDREAVATLNRALDRDDPPYIVHVQAASLLAMAHARLGERDAAHRALSEASRAAAAEPRRPEPNTLVPGWHWREQVLARLLRQEAESVVLDLDFPADPFTQDRRPPE